MKSVSRFVWRESTRNHHVADLGDYRGVASVVRSQKHRSDGTPYDWQIEVLGSRQYDDQFEVLFDPRDLDSTKSAAEARAKWAITVLYERLTT
jgi:hypothetical protein